MFVVAPNFIDRTNKALRWLVRHENTTANERNQLAVESVVMKNAQFKASGDIERGFGCSVVCFGEEPKAVSNFELSENHKKLYITIFGTVKLDDQPLGNETFPEIVMMPDGSVYARLPEPQAD